MAERDLKYIDKENFNKYKKKLIAGNFGIE